MDHINNAIAAIQSELKTAGELPRTFWTSGEIPDKIGYATSDSLVTMRHTRLREWLLSNGHPCFDEELRALCLWHKVRGGRVKIPVMGFKYLLLKAWEKDEPGSSWSLDIDKRVEMLALEIVREHKEKPGT